MNTTLGFPQDRKFKQVWVLKAKDCSASAILIVPNSFRGDWPHMLVLEGSMFRTSAVAKCNPDIIRIRECLFTRGYLARKDEYQSVLTQDVIFSSPSAAACSVTGASKNGLDFWKYGIIALGDADPLKVAVFYERPCAFFADVNGMS